MKKLALLCLAAVAFLSGCVVAPYDDGRPYHARGYYGDRDGDGIANGVDRRPNNPRRY